MLSLYFITCLGSGYCVTRQHSFDETVATPQQCVSVAQAAIARWVSDREHERWRVEAFRCGKPRRSAGAQAPPSDLRSSRVSR